MDHPQPGSLAPIQHPPGTDFVPPESSDEVLIIANRPSMAGRIVEGFIAVAIVGILVALLLPSQVGGSYPAPHSARSEREARKLELQQALAEQEDYLRQVSVEGAANDVASVAVSDSE